jgi:hypothetical protein
VKTNFWSPEAVAVLVSAGRQDVVDRGDDLAQRVSALMSTALVRLEDYVRDGDLYCGRGGLDLVGTQDAVESMDEFVNVRLKAEIKALELLLKTFDDIRTRHEPRSPSLPSWY